MGFPHFGCHICIFTQDAGMGQESMRRQMSPKGLVFSSVTRYMWVELKAPGCKFSACVISPVEIKFPMSLTFPKNCLCEKQKNKQS